MKTDLEIINEVSLGRGFYVDGLSGEQLEFVHLCMVKAREEELKGLKEAVNPEEGHNGFSKILLNNELKKFKDEGMNPRYLNINPDDFFEWCETERLITGIDPRKSLRFGINKIEGLILNVSNNVKPGFWTLTFVKLK